MRERTMEMLADEAIEALPATVSLVYVDYRDQLTDEQVAALVKNDMDTLNGMIWEWESDIRVTSCDETAQEVVKEVISRWEREDDADYSALAYAFDYSDERERLHEAIYERDDSDPLSDLARATPEVLLRINVIDEDNGYSFEEVAPERVLTDVGLPINEHNVRVMRATLAECSPEFSVLMGYWIVGMDVEDLYHLATDVAEIEIEEPYLYLGNPFAGSGFISEEAFQGTVRVRREELRTDKDAFGYPVSEVYGGLAASQFHCKVHVAES